MKRFRKYLIVPLCIFVRFAILIGMKKDRKALVKDLNVVTIWRGLWVET